MVLEVAGRRRHGLIRVSFKTPPCVHSKSLRVCWQRPHALACGRFASTHGNVHTETLTYTRKNKDTYTLRQTYTNTCHAHTHTLTHSHFFSHVSLGSFCVCVSVYVHVCVCRSVVVCACLRLSGVEHVCNFSGVEH